jgi:hypothetical protein
MPRLKTTRTMILIKLDINLAQQPNRKTDNRATYDKITGNKKSTY